MTRVLYLLLAALLALQLPAAARARPQAAPAPYQVVVKKSFRVLELYRGGKLLKSYPVALGGEPIADKRQQGDMATPEGEFYICMKFVHPTFSHSLGISYPNGAHAARGLQQKLIGKREYDAILAALKARSTPPWNTRLGGDILIHGGGIGRDWTLGCVALENEDIAEIYRLVPVGTRVTIRQ